MSSNIKIQRNCEHCGCEFTAQTTTTRYCSHRCSNLAYKVRKRSEKIEAVKAPPMKKTEAKALDFYNLEGREYLTVKEAAMLLRCSVRSMYRLVDEGKLKAINLGERMTRIKRTDIENLKLDTLYEEITALDISDCYTITEIQYKFGVSSKALLDIIKRNRIPRIKQGKFVYVPKELINRIFNNL